MKVDVREAPAVVRAARLRATLTQAELAGRAGVQQSNIAAIESGARAVSGELLDRILVAAG
jgi:transcriptional regulator with XRE-family HTH domain